MKAVEFRDVSFRYNENSPVILRKVNFSMEYGKTVLITGASGTGKTTIMSLINGTIPNYTEGQLAGTVLVNGESTAGKSIAELSVSVGSVLQNADLQIVHDIVEDEIAFGAENLGETPGRITQHVDRMTGIMKIDPKQQTRKLSGGQKQRLITASTLAMGQKIILLDEPLANLDRAGADLILTELKRLAHEEGYLVIIVEHRIDYVIDYIDEIYMLSDAELVRTGVEELKSRNAAVIACPVSRSTEKIVLSAKNISVSFGKRQILCDVSLDVHEGEKLMLVGENGCGKTTLTRVLARLLKPDSGSVESVYGRKPNRAWFKNVGYVYQNPNYQLFMPTAEREIDFACTSPELKAYAIERLGLQELLERHPYSLSEGQKRKLAVAAIVCACPKILFLDEPTVGQDNKSLDALIDVILYLNKKYGTALVSVSHDKRCIEPLSDRVINLQK